MRTVTQYPQSLVQQLAHFTHFTPQMPHNIKQLHIRVNFSLMSLCIQRRCCESVILLSMAISIM